MNTAKQINVKIILCKFIFLSRVAFIGVIFILTRTNDTFQSLNSQEDKLKDKTKVQYSQKSSRGGPWDVWLSKTMTSLE